MFMLLNGIAVYCQKTGLKKFYISERTQFRGLNMHYAMLQWTKTGFNLQNGIDHRCSWTKSRQIQRQARTSGRGVSSMKHVLIRGNGGGRPEAIGFFVFICNVLTWNKLSTPIHRTLQPCRDKRTHVTYLCDVIVIWITSELGEGSYEYCRWVTSNRGEAATRGSRWFHLRLMHVCWDYEWQFWWKYV